MKRLPGLIWFISDHHFGHKKALSWEKRPFSSLQDMEDKMVASWNAVVEPEDCVCHLGDFNLYSKIESTSNLVGRLNGSIFLVMGNHDRKSPGWYIRAGFAGATRNPLIRGNVVLSHAPLSEEELAGRTNIHGHCHASLEMMWMRPYYHVSCEAINYIPVQFDLVSMGWE